MNAPPLPGNTTSNVNDLFAVPNGLVARSVNEKDPGVVGVPLRRPISAEVLLRLSPGGRDPETSVKVVGESAGYRSNCCE